MFLFFDRIFTGAPNITGGCGYSYASQNTYGAFYSSTNVQTGHPAAGGDPTVHLNISRSSGEYMDTVNEIRVKSVTSKGFIKLF